MGRNDQLTIKIGKIYGIEHNKGSKKYPQNQVIFDCIVPNIPLKHKCNVFKYHSDMGHCFSYMLVEVVSKKNIYMFFYFSKLGKTDMALGKKVDIFLFGMGPKFGPKCRAENLLDCNCVYYLYSFYSSNSSPFHQTDRQTCPVLFWLTVNMSYD